MTRGQTTAESAARVWNAKPNVSSSDSRPTGTKRLFLKIPSHLMHIGQIKRHDEMAPLREEAARAAVLVHGKVTDLVALGPASIRTQSASQASPARTVLSTSAERYGSRVGCPTWVEERY